MNYNEHGMWIAARVDSCDSIDYHAAQMLGEERRMREWQEHIQAWARNQKWLTSAVSALLAIAIGLGALYFQAPHSSKPGVAVNANPAPTIRIQTPTPTMTPIPFQRPEVEAGVAFPHWNTSAYGDNDLSWRSGLSALQGQTGARWVSIVVNLYQDNFQSTTIHAGSGTPTPQALAQGITYAHSLGLKVFIEPLLTVTASPNWSGLIYFDTYDQASAWFEGYWNGYQPYVVAAAAAGADQLGVATELQALEQQPASLWNTLIGHVRSAFHGKLTYDINWNSLSLHIPSWLSNPQLDYIGISEYQPITQSPRTLSADAILAVWRSQTLPSLDRFSERIGKPLIFSEIGYRNATDALYRPWDHSTSAPPDPALQAAAYTAAARAVFGDKHIVGLFIWAWDNGVFAPSAPATAALKSQYLSTAA